MPELPEVETVRRGLEPHVVGGFIDDIEVGDSKIFQIEPHRLIEQIRGQKILGLTRRGKFLIFELERHYFIFHFGMTGQLTFRDPNRSDAEGFKRHPVTGLQRTLQHAPDRHTHLQIHLRQGGSMLFRDIRKFGKVFLIEKGEVSVFFERLGLEPWTPDYNLKAFLQKFGKRKLAIKSLLLDQSFVAGVGNIYADEALFASGIHPARKVRSLRKAEKESLFEAIPKVLEKGIEYGGTTLRDFVNSDGYSGSHQEKLQVYGRKGESCHRCNTLIQRMVISQRSTCFCPACQPRGGRSPARKAPI